MHRLDHLRALDEHLRGPERIEQIGAAVLELRGERAIQDQKRARPERLCDRVSH